MSNSQDICSPYKRKTDRTYTRIVLLKRYRWPDRDAPRDMPGYTGDGPAETLAIVLERLGAQMQAAWDRGREEQYEELQQRSARMAKREREAAE